MSSKHTPRREVSCPPAPEQYAPTTRVHLRADVREGEIIVIDPVNTVNQVRSVSGIQQKRRKFAVGAHNQEIGEIRQIQGCLAVCIDSGRKGELVSCQRHGVVNLLLKPEKKRVAYNDRIFGDDICSAGRKTVTRRAADNSRELGRVVSVYDNNPARGYTTVRVRLTL